MIREYKVTGDSTVTIDIPIYHTHNIENIGNGDLNISSIYLHNGNSNFTITLAPTGIVESNRTVELIVSYSPGTYETNYETISIVSNDEDEPIVTVTLDGSGDAPVITLRSSRVR